MTRQQGCLGASHRTYDAAAGMLRSVAQDVWYDAAAGMLRSVAQDV